MTGRDRTGGRSGWEWGEPTHDQENRTKALENTLEVGSKLECLSLHPAPGSGLECGQRQRRPTTQRQPAWLWKPGGPQRGPTDPRLGLTQSHRARQVRLPRPNNAPAELQSPTEPRSRAVGPRASPVVPPPCSRRARGMRDSAAFRPAMPDRGKSARRHRGQRTRGPGAAIPEKPGAEESVPPSAF